MLILRIHHVFTVMDFLRFKEFLYKLGRFSVRYNVNICIAYTEQRIFLFNQHVSIFVYAKVRSLLILDKYVVSILQLSLPLFLVFLSK